MDKKIIHTVFEQVASQNVHAPAIEFQGDSLDYGDLDRWASRISSWCSVAYKEPESVVALFMPACPGYVAALLGVLQSGGVFMPLDPAFPEKRLGTLLRKTTPCALITTAEHEEQARRALSNESVQIPVLVIDGSCAGSEAEYKTELSPSRAFEITGDSGCYIIFTSGSTGEPKAILGVQKGLSHFIHWEMKELGLDSSIRGSFLAPPTFDVSLRDIFVPLLSGGTLCIPTAETRSNAGALVQWIRDSRLTLSHCVPSILRNILHETELLPREQRPSTFRFILAAGEPLYGRDVAKCEELFGGRVEVINLYGPSETTLAKAFFRTKGQALAPQEIVPIGNPISNAALLILKDGKLCAVGETGEIYINTPFRSKGYYRDEKLTQESFVVNPLTQEPADIIYKTGDLGKYRPDRSVAILGRVDRQVKINGVRIELNEIEQAVQSHPSVRQAVVIAHKSTTQESVLACYYTVAQGAFSPDDLRAHLAGELPSYMAPAFILKLEEFPVLLNGKIDKKALPKPEDLLYAANEYVAPQGKTEETLARIWGEILGLAKVGVTTPFLELGGDSLKAIRVVSQIARDLSVEIPLKTLFDHPTIRALAEKIGGQSATDIPAIVKIPDAPSYPLSFAQRRLWILEQIEEDSIAYNICDAFRLKGELNYSALEEAFALVIKRHESLRTSFAMVDAEPRQAVHAEVEFHIEKLDLSNEANPEEKVIELCQSEALTPFDLSSAPLFRVTLIKLANGHHILLSNVHHIISDGWSFHVLVGELLSAYRAFVSNESPELAPLGLQYRDYAAWQEKLLNGGKLEHSRDYWKAKLGSEHALVDLPLDFSRPPVQSFRGATLVSSIDRKVLSGLNRIAQSSNSSLFMVLTSAVKAFLFRYTRQGEITVGTPAAARPHSALQDQIGFYVNMLPLRDQINGSESFLELLSRVRATTLEAFEHQLYPFDRLVEDLAVSRDAGHPPLYNVIVALQNMEIKELLFAGTAVEEYPVAEQTSKSDLSFLFRERGEQGLELSLNYNTDLFSAETIESFAQHLNVLVRSIISDSKQAIQSLHILTEKEERELAQLQSKEWVSRDRTILELFREQVSQRAEHTAVVGDGESRTYRELDELSDRVAKNLLRICVPGERSLNEKPVAVMLDRSTRWLTVLLGVMKAGGAYLPVDPSYPGDRIAHMLERSEAIAAVTERDVAVPDGPKRIHLNDLFVDAIESQLPTITADQVAYLIFTSGSTGRPKGGLIEHGAFTSMLRDVVSVWGIDRNSVVLQFASISFDASVIDVFMGLLTGATLAIVTREQIDNKSSFKEFLLRHGVTHATLPPVYLSVLERASLPTLKTIVTAGEAANVEDSLFYAREKKVFNGYGPSECSVCVSSHQVDPKRGYPRGIPIGKPLKNSTLIVVDENLTPLPHGARGEICVAGNGIGRGYVNEPELTADRFVTIAGCRMYRTGDTGVLRRNGEFEFCGRKDNQVKIAGHRIELDEIKHAIQECERVRDAVVALRELTGRDKMLVAYYIEKPEAPSARPAARELKEKLHSRLPSYMIPGALIPVETIPLTTNGKVDFKALHSLALEEGESKNAPPQSPAEKLLYEAWCAVLRRSDFGIDDNYFTLGGDSIRAIQIVSRLYEQGWKMEVRQIFQTPTIAALALRLQPVERKRDQGPVAGAVALTPIQRWLLTDYRGSVNHFNQSVRLRFVRHIDERIIRECLAAIVRHHDALRTSFASGKGGYEQVIHESSGSVDFAVVEVKHEEEAEWVIAETQRSMVLAEPTLFKARLLKTGEWNDLFIAVHHLVIDTVSWRIVLEDLTTAYDQLQRGEKIALPLKTDSYQQYAAVLSKTSGSTELLKEIPYWQQAGPGEGNAESAVEPAKDSGRCTTTLSVETTSALLTRAHLAYNTRVDDLLLTAWARALRKVKGTKSTVVALERHGRDELPAELDVGRTVGWFTVSYPFLLELPESGDAGREIVAVKESLRQVPHGGSGYGLLRYGAEKDRLGSSPTPEMTFNYLGQFGAEVSNHLFRVIDPTGERHDRELSAPRLHAMDFEAFVQDGQLTVEISFSRKKFSEQVVTELLKVFAEELVAVVEFCSCRGEQEMTPSDFTYSKLSLEELDEILDNP